MKLEIMIPGQPQVQQRARMGRQGHFYDPSSRDKKAFGLALLYARQTHKMAAFEGDLSLSLEFYYQPHGRRKFDVDNLVKFVMDSANGILWKDDTQVFQLRAEKFGLSFGEPHTKIALRHLTIDDQN